MDKLALVDSSLANIIIEKMNSVNVDINDLQNKIDLLEKEEIASSYNKEDFKLKEENRKHFIEDFENMDMEEKQNSIRGVINKVVWDGKNIIIS